MKCLHCFVEFHPEPATFHLQSDGEGSWDLCQYICPACHKSNLLLQTVDYDFNGNVTIFQEIVVRPLSGNRCPAPAEVPAYISDDYREASLILLISPKASAALSRRCLQNLLRDAAKVKHNNLDKEIQEVLDRNELPSYLAMSIDAIRNIGNFAAHPLKSKNTGEIMPVEPKEAEWNLDVLEALFDFYYVQPAIIAKKRAALNAKLDEAGKPKMK